MAGLAAEAGLEIICRPLTSHDVVINSIAATTTRAGLTVQARLDDGTYPTGVKVSNAQMAARGLEGQERPLSDC